MRQSDPVDRENMLSFSLDGSILFDHAISLSEMISERILEEYLYLNSTTAQEKDERYGTSLGLSYFKQSRLDKLRSHILQALTTEPTRLAQEQVCKLAAQRLSGSDWHKLSDNEKKQAELLLDGGYLIKSLVGGFVGKVKS